MSTFSEIVGQRSVKNAIKIHRVYKMKRQQIWKIIYLIFKSKNKIVLNGNVIAALNLDQTFLQAVQTLRSKKQMSARKYRYLHTLRCPIKGYTHHFNSI